MSKSSWLFGLAAVTLILSGCHWDMWVQPKAKAQEWNPYWNSISNNPSSTRAPLNGTVPFGQDRKDTAYYTGFENGVVVKEFPIPVTHELIERGRERFTIFCSHCHGQLGDGKGMINQRGFIMARPVASYHTYRLRQMPVGHFFDVMTTGFGAMYPFAARISPHDRWAIASYIRVLQFSYGAKIEDLDDKARHLYPENLTSIPQNTGQLFVSPAITPTTWPPASPPVANVPRETAPGIPGTATPGQAGQEPGAKTPIGQPGVTAPPITPPGKGQPDQTLKAGDGH